VAHLVEAWDGKGDEAVQDDAQRRVHERLVLPAAPRTEGKTINNRDSHSRKEKKTTRAALQVSSTSSASKMPI